MSAAVTARKRRQSHLKDRFLRLWMLTRFLVVVAVLSRLRETCRSSRCSPAPPPPQSCGLQKCAQYVEEGSEVGAKGCCTKELKCGSKSEFLFGDQCLPRGGAAGTKKAECNDESVNFVDLDGCCRSDGKCGLSIDAVPNFDLGCLERTAMAKLLNDGAAKRKLLSAVFFLPVKDAVFPAKSCTP